MSSFDTAINRLLGHEDGYVNDPQDPGGETKFGISKRSYPNLDIKSLTREQAIAIYHRDFWSKIDADSMPESIGFQLLDCAANSGIGAALRLIQRAVGVADDGHVGPFTMAAIKKTAPHDLIMLFLAKRLRYMTDLKNWPAHGRGWARRVAGNLEYGAQDV